MKAEKLMRAIGGISPRHIERDVRRKRPSRRLAAAACALILLGLAAAVIFYFAGREKLPSRQAAAPTPTAPAEVTASPTAPITNLPTEAPTEAPTPEPIICTLLSRANGGQGDYSSLGRSEEASLWGINFFNSEDAPREVTITFEGDEYTGTYETSVCGRFHSYIEHRYRTQNRDEICVNSVTGELTAISLDLDERNESKLADLDDPAADTARIAKEFASGFVANIEEYTQSDSAVFEIDNDLSVYSYLFDHNINGFNTSDRLYVKVTSKGTVIYISFGDPSAYPIIAAGYERFKDLDLEAYMTEIILPCIPEGYTVSGEIKINRALYAVSPYDGEVVLCVEAYLQATDQYGEGPWAFGGIFILR